MAATSRVITRNVLATAAGPLQRLVGTVDFKGQGTKHSITDVDPVVLCDYSGVISGVGKPPFGLHPHYGLIAVTTVLEGAFSDKDNINGENDHLNKAGDIYAVSAGRGVCHEEKTAIEGNHRAVQTIFKIPKDKMDLPPELIKVQAKDIPVVKVDGGTVKVLVGRLGEVESPARLKTLPRVVMLRINLEAGRKVEPHLDNDLVHGFVFVTKGRCRLGIERMAAGEGEGIWLFGAGGGLAVETEEEGVEMLVVAGKPLAEPWVKMLGRNGFIITSTEEEAEKVMEVVHRTGDEFTFQKL